LEPIVSTGRDYFRWEGRSCVFGDEPGVWPRLDAVYRPEQVGADILLVHDADDDVSAPGQSRVIAAAYGERARLVETRGLGHRRILGDPEVIALAVEFVTTGSVGGSAAEGSAVVPAV
jgi:pimeloyl-ACP methyl ester carboxylesterase